MSADLPERELEQQYPGTAAEAQADTEEWVLVNLSTSFPATRISQEQFTKALVSLVKDMPLPEKGASRPLPHPGLGIVLTSGSATGAAWLTPLAQDYGRFCAQRGTPGDCLDRFGDGPELDNDDKRAIALALAIGPALDAADAEIRAMITPTRLLTMVSLSITGYMALLIVPEPISKGVAAVATVLLWGYLKRFGAEALHNTENVIKAETKVHMRISAYYSSRQPDTGNKVVREWLRMQSYEQQRAFGLKVLRDFGVIP